MPTRTTLRALRGAAALALALAAAPAAGQQAPAPVPLSLAEALDRAEEASEAVIIARAGVTRARGEVYRARSEYFPQVSGSVSYSRALASEFQGLGGGGSDSTATPAPVPCGTFVPNPALPVAERLDSLEAAVECAQNANPFASFGDLPFGRENTWRYGFNVSQNVFTGGRLRATNRVADAGRRTADIALASARAQLALDVTQAYYDAVLAERLLQIAEATLQQSEATLEQTRLAREVGNLPEFELLRATVTRDNQRPVVIQRRSERDLSALRLKQLLDLPADPPLALTTPLNDARPPSVAPFAAEAERLGDTATDVRAPVRQAAEAVAVQENLLRVARSQRWPQVSLNMTYGRVGYPQDGIPAFDDFNTNWTVGAALSVPLFTGGRLRGDELVARANLMESRARLTQVRQLAELDARTAQERLEAARATWEASAGTVEQAQRAYGIAEIRYREGLSTQVELSDARLLLQQAEANRAVAARDLQIAQVRVALLPYLPLSAGGAGAAPPQQTQTQQQQAPRQQQPAASDAAFTGAGF